MGTGTGIERIDHRSCHGCWTLFRRRPPVPLRPYVREIQGYVEAGGIPVHRKELPSGVVPLILIFDAGFTLHDPDQPAQGRPLRRSFVAGLHEGPALVGSAGSALCMQVDLTPIGARRFLRLDMHELAGQVVELGAILGGLAEALDERLAAVRDWPQRFALLERVLAERILCAPDENPLLRAAWRALDDSGGAIGIAALADRLGCSRKHLVTLFRQGVGLPPKRLARILRFARALARLHGHPPGSLADLAAWCGYADQAHFNRDFRAFAGESPTALLARILPDGTGIMGEPW